MHLTVVLDCTDAEVLASFWAAALGYSEVAREGAYIALRPQGEPGRSRPTLVLQQVPEPKVGKNRMHLDVFADDFDADLSRLQGRGATTLVPPYLEPDGTMLTVLADPEGNEFCLLAARAESTESP